MGAEQARGGRRGRGLCLSAPSTHRTSCTHSAPHTGAPSHPFFRPSYHPPPPCPPPLSPSPGLHAFSPPAYVPPLPRSRLPLLKSPSLLYPPPSHTSHQIGKAQDTVGAFLTPPSDSRHYACTFCDRTIHGNPPLSSRKRDSMGRGRPAPGDSSGGTRESGPWHGRARQRQFQCKYATVEIT